jgi:hypothetical protein
VDYGLKLRDGLAIDICQCRVEQGFGFRRCGDFGLDLRLLIFEDLELDVESKSVGAPPVRIGVQHKNRHRPANA